LAIKDVGRPEWQHGSSDQHQMRWLSNAVAEYIVAQRDRYTPRAEPFTEQLRRALAAFFTPAVLGTRVVTLHSERVHNPDFYPQLEALGFRNLPDQSTMGAITFGDVVVSHLPLNNGLLFHELVYIEQIPSARHSIIFRTVRDGLFNGGCYEGIPLEVHAYALGARYQSNTHEIFSVEDAVRDCICRRAY